MATITEKNGGLAVCQEALVLLRQDRDLPKTEDGTLDLSRDVVAKKVDRVYDSTRSLVIGAHGWNALALDENGDASNVKMWPRQIRAAFVALLARELAIPVTGRQEDLKAMHELYEMKLADAKVWDWRNGLENEQDPVVREAFAGIQEKSDGKAEKDWSYRRMRERIVELKDRTRAEVLQERDWNFARRSANVMADDAMSYSECYGPSVFVAALPYDCLKIHSVEGRDGQSLAREGWWIEDGFLKCRGGEPVGITYTADMKNVERWDPVVREAYYTLLMCKVAKSTPEIGVRVQLLNGEYAELIRKAALTDARETQPGRVSWGENDYADAIRGCGRHDFRRGRYVR